MIRDVSPGDAPRITEIYNRYILGSTATFETVPLSVAEMARRIESIAAAFPYIIYVEDGVVIGYAYAHLWRERAAYRATWEATVYLAPEARGRGVGTELLRELLRRCRRGGARALIACITAENSASRHMCERMGFRQVSLFEKVGEKMGRLLDVADYELLL